MLITNDYSVIITCDHDYTMERRGLLVHWLTEVTLLTKINNINLEIRNTILKQSFRSLCVILVVISHVPHE